MKHKDLKKATSWQVSHYNSIRDSVVSWRKKSSYRKKLKRYISKAMRRLNKHLD